MNGVGFESSQFKTGGQKKAEENKNGDGDESIILVFRKVTAIETYMYVADYRRSFRLNT